MQEFVHDTFKTYHYYTKTIAASYINHHLVWATELSLAAIGLVFPVLVLGYKSFNHSMYQVPVPTLIG